MAKSNLEKLFRISNQQRKNNENTFLFNNRLIAKYRKNTGVVRIGSAVHFSLDNSCIF